jgi:hypothetical protein
MTKESGRSSEDGRIDPEERQVVHTEIGHFELRVGEPDDQMHPARGCDLQQLLTLGT